MNGITTIGYSLPCDLWMVQAADPRHVDQRVRVFFDHVERVFPEPLHDLPGELRLDAFYESRAEIFLDAADRRGESLFELLRGELPAIPGVDLSGAVQRQDRADMRFWHESHDSDQVRVALGSALDHGVAVILILICNSLNDAAKMIHISLSEGMLVTVPLQQKCKEPR